MLSDEEKEIFNNLKDYMQSNIDNGYHKFIYNDLGWDFKCIDCINAIDKVLKQYKQLNENYILRVESEQKEKKAYIDGTNIVDKLCNKKWKDKIKAKIEEVKDGTYDAKIVLQSLLEKE